MPKYLPAQKLVTGLMILLGIEAALAVCAMGSSLLQVGLLTRIMAGGDFTQAEAEFNDLRERAIGVLTLVVSVVSGVIFLKYVGRLNHNARAMGAENLSATPGWTIGYFFVPFLNLFKPYQILQEIWKASAPEPGNWTRRDGATLIGWYWAVRLIDSFANQAVFRMTLGSDPDSPNYFDELMAATWISFGVEAIDGVLSLICMVLVRSFQQRQEARYEKIGVPGGVQCPSCGESLAGEVLFETTCPVCGSAVQPATA